MKKFIEGLNEDIILKVFFFAYLFALFCGALGNTFTIMVIGTIFTIIIGIAVLYLSIRYERNHSDSDK